MLCGLLAVVVDAAKSAEETMSETHNIVVPAFLNLVLSEPSVRGKWLSFQAWRALLYRRYAFKDVLDFVDKDLGRSIDMLTSWDKSSNGRQGVSIYVSTRKSCIISKDLHGKDVKAYKRFIYVHCKKIVKRVDIPPYIPSKSADLLPIFEESSSIVCREAASSSRVKIKSFVERSNESNLDNEIDGFLERKRQEKIAVSRRFKSLIAATDERGDVESPQPHVVTPTNEDNPIVSYTPSTSYWHSNEARTLFGCNNIPYRLPSDYLFETIELFDRAIDSKKADSLALVLLGGEEAEAQLQPHQVLRL
jgi:hypothetical protein